MGLSKGKKLIKMKTNLLVLFFVLMIGVTSGLAQNRVDGRQKAQRVRIANGRAEGEVTKGEAVLLRKEQRHIRRAERRAKSDGSLTPREKMRLERKQDRASRHIRRAKSNPLDNN
jgi:acetyl-CoA carboxylase carboxyltransferase component